MGISRIPDGTALIRPGTRSNRRCHRLWHPAPVTGTICLTQDAAADELLSRDPLALLIGMVLDQQVPMERAFAAPELLRQRLGCPAGEPLSAAEIAEHDPAALAATFAQPPALHRFPASMAARVQSVCRVLEQRYGGDAAALWHTAGSGAELLARLRELPGFGPVKAQIFLALLGKQAGVRPAGWREVAGELGVEGSLVSVADVTDAASLAAVRAHKQASKAQAKAAAGGG